MTYCEQISIHHSVKFNVEIQAHFEQELLLMAFSLKYFNPVIPKTIL